MENNHRLRLNEEYSNYLENIPESGMGYHLVNLDLSNGKKIRNRVVLNSSLVELKFNDEFSNEDILRLEIASD